MIFEKVREMLARQMEIDESEITMDTHIVDDLGADSLDAVDLITTVEDEFSIFITDEEAKDLFTVSEIVNFISRKKG